MASTVEIFVSYRRGEPNEPKVDQPNAGRIHDYLTGLGYQSYYDNDESRNPTGAQFPDTIEASLISCKIIIAVISKSWIEQIRRLQNPDDWVRKELLRAAPGGSRHLIPIYISAQPADLSDQLPEALAFLKTANSHYIWSGFEDQQKAALSAKLRELLPGVSVKGKVCDMPRLELLCDRQRQEDCFDDALHRRVDAKRPGGWLLFGEVDQGQEALFERIRSFTLKRDKFKKRYPVPSDIQLQFEDRINREALDRHVFDRAGEKLGGLDIASYEQLYCELKRSRISLAIFYSVVTVTTPKQAQRWIERFTEMHSCMPDLPADGAEVIFVLSIAYEEQRPKFLSAIWSSPPIRAFFEGRFPQHFNDELTELADDRKQIWISRLTSAGGEHVRNWYDNRDVHPHIEAIPKQQFLEPFADGEKLPMDIVTEHLRGVIKRHIAATS